jgi:hypothetical protein
MPDPRILEDEALLALHAALEIDQLWSAINELMQAYLPSHRVTLFLGHIGMHEARKVFTAPPIDSPDKDYFVRRAEKNPFNAYIENHVGAPYYRFSDVITDYKTFESTEFFKEFAQSEGWHFGLSGLVWLGDELHGMFSLYRTKEEGDFDRPCPPSPP